MFFCYNKKNKLKEGTPIMEKFQVIAHPLIQHKLSILRRTDTSTKAFRELVNEIAMLMGYEVLRDLPLSQSYVQVLVW